MASKNANEGRMKPTYKELYIERDALFLRLKAANKELAELRQALTGRTMSCVWCNDTAKQRDEAIRERDEARAMMVKLCHKVADAALSEQAQEKTVALPDPHWRTSPPYDFRKVTQQDVERLMDNPIIKDIKFKAVDDDTN